MWPNSPNISVIPDPFKKMSGRPDKNKMIEQGKIKSKMEKISRGRMIYNVEFIIPRVTIKQNIQEMHLLLALIQILAQDYHLLSSSVGPSAGLSA